MNPKTAAPFAIWITGFPASGKSTLAAALGEQLAAHRVHATVLESDQLRRTLAPDAGYSESDRNAFYQQMLDIGLALLAQGRSVIFDATANRRVYRDRARRQIARFLEVYVDVPLETCMARDPKGIYRQAQQGGTATVPGLQTNYEPPEHPDVVVREGDSMESAAARIVAALQTKGFLNR